MKREKIYVYGSCEECGILFEGETTQNRKGEVVCPKCGNKTANWNDEEFYDLTKREIKKIGVVYFQENIKDNNHLSLKKRAENIANYILNK